MDTRAHNSTANELKHRAENMFEVVRARAAEAEAQRRISDKSIQEFIDSGFHRIAQPERFGGFGLGPDAIIDPVMAISRACGSSGWIVNVMAMHNWQVSLFSDAAQEEYWAGSKDIICATAAFSVEAKIEHVEGGVCLSGRWKFASGADFASWFLIMRPKPGVFDWMLVPRSEVEILDDWFVSGLCGTGSKDIVLDGVFVPSHRILSAADLGAGTTPGASLYDDPFYRAPFLSYAASGLASAIIGMADGLVGAYEAGLVNKRTLHAGQLQTDRGSNQVKLADAVVDIKVANYLLRDAVGEAGRWGVEGVPEDGSAVITPNLDMAYAVRKAVDVARSLSIASGANATYHKSPVQRLVRDIFAGGSHAAFAYEEVAEGFGKARWAKAAS